VIPIAKPDLGPEEAAAVAEVLASGTVAQGPRVRELEERWAAYCGVRHAIAMSNGTTALMSIFAGLGLGPDDEVVTVAHTFAASANAVVYTGARPVFIDVEPDTYLIDPSLVEAAITPRTRAIMPVHLFGLIADMDPLLEIADRHQLKVVEDACQAHGATYKGRRAGSFATSAFSLYATKNMTTGEGGFVTTDDDGLADWLRMYRNQGMRGRYEHEIVGFNFRMTDIQAAIGLVQLDKLERNTARRQAIAARYTDAFAGLPARPQAVPAGRAHVYHQYVIDVGPERDEILAKLRSGGVGADVYYPIPVHRQRQMVDRGFTAELPVTDAACARTIALPIYAGLTDTDQETVIEAVRSAVGSRATGVPS
jgi:dTDP-4-amino-4,6-dideoxygalactose transaminase